ncbi:PTS sugar transporter subunit IIB [Companilactobacillus bobalius]|uniref:Protein-N(Pi)-phosphohistidine--sugar phosphotransferase n=2 Tax=Companilactobacillus bobalius TaxID=2801451 RepID=A0A202FA50_9LACO|nr:PTS sugar transporter subunit IIB [Companilactobacillus bobalius]KAE9564278.1 PTS sugar transporter subunit IIB [Companilactobacillus bobalius]OVE97332.1 Protein-N(pi)-phosphohistidine--sugar phosphotransferase [Companilactobacillus bobalius]GEO58281.1 PTS sugar transporter subunit IIB [Companilactobacillus paralimentarius]
MEKLTIMLACGNGMSTSLLAKRMQDAADKQGLDAVVFAGAVKTIPSEMDKKHPDVVLIGPQVRYVVPELKEKLDVPVEMINTMDYGMMNGENVLETAKKLVAASK